ncbi:MAG TPA: EamA family transporter [Candidatus Nanoarchaeia archaeon]|nr:EamA family transporter [Candidatus Nanoarchaeia archaeon]
MIYVPILGALALAGGTIFQRVIIKKKRIGIKQYYSAEFLAIILITLPLIFFFWKMDPEALELRNLIIFSLIIVFSLIANYLVLYSAKWEKVTHLEPAKLTESLFTVLLAVIFSFIFGAGLYERNLNVIIPAIIASLALVFSHIKKHHLDFNKYFVAALFGSFFFALELVLSRLILDSYSSLTFYFLRCLAIFIITFIAFKPNLGSLEGKLKIKILGIGALWVIYRVIIYYGFVNLGVIYTTLSLMLSPLFIYFFAHKFLKERLEWRNIIAAIVILASIIYASVA